MRGKGKVTGFSSFNRKEILAELQSQTFDLLVIGGGVTGCGIALDAASRGMEVALIEMEDFASGTSSKSTKLIHGGLRYLKQLDIALVNETGTERAILNRLAPHLVVPEKMLMPITKNGTYGKWAASFGVMVYDLLAGVKGDDKRKMLSSKKTLKKEPLLNPNGLQGGCYYAEYRTDDARLTIEIAKTAIANGARILNRCKALSFIHDATGKVSGVSCSDEIGGTTIEIKAAAVVSAAGPWVDELRKEDGSLEGKRLFLTKGVHLVFPHDKIPLNNSIYFDNPDGRMLFAIPRGKVTYVGTTDTEYKGDRNHITATKEDLEYILKAIKVGFPSVDVTAEDVISNWAGVRPLIHQDGKSPSELSRKDEIFESESGLISIAGGKLTGYRMMAKRIVNLVAKRTPKDLKSCQTKTLPLTPDCFENMKAVAVFRDALKMDLEQYGLGAYDAWYLTANYGLQAKDILAKADWSNNNNADLALVLAELSYCLENEMINDSCDFWIRRTGRLYFDIESVTAFRKVVAEKLASQLGWDETQMENDRKQLGTMLVDATNYPA